MSRYEIEWDGRYIDYRQKEMYGPRYPELFESKKVVVRDVTGENEQLIVSFDSTKSYCDHLVTCVVYYESMEGTGAELNFEGHPRIAPPYPSLEYLTAILASKLMTFIFRLHFATGTLQGDYSHTYPQQVRALPIRRIAFTTSAKRRAELVAQAKDLSSRQDHPSTASLRDSAQDGLLAFVEQRLAAQPEESDVVHDVLAFLAEQMIDLNKRKQVEQKRFLGWLESLLFSPSRMNAAREGGRMKEKIHPSSFSLQDLTGKSRLRNYLGDYQKGEGELAFEDVVDILHKNRTKIGISLSEARLMARLWAEYEQSVETLKPLKAQLAWTDGVIDQIVYRLYGLTGEEISVVEGKG